MTALRVQYRRSPADMQSRIHPSSAGPPGDRHEQQATHDPSEAFVETLVAQGVKDVFGIVGSAFMDALDLFPAAGIRFVPTVHEQGAAHMADGYSRVTGRHGVCIAQNGPGITNFVTGVAAAYWAHSPVVAITPETGTSGMGLGGFQETEQLPIFSRITKYQAHVNRADRMAEFTAKAFDNAMAERGPAQLNIPRDYFYGEIDVAIPEPRRVRRGPGAEEDLEAAARLLAEARFPVIVAGGGVLFSDGQAECVALAELLGAPVVTSYLHNDAFPSRHPLWCGPLGYQGAKAGMKLLSEADVVLALGTRLGPFGTLPQHGLDYWPKNARIIQVDADHRMLGLVRPVSVGICGDAAGGGGAGGQAGRARAGLLGHAERARRPHHFREERLGKGTGRLVARARRLEPGHHQPGRRPHASAPHTARAGTGHAQACDGVHRHRQYLLGVQQLSALRRTEFHAGGHELRQLRLRAAGADRRQAGPA